MLTKIGSKIEDVSAWVGQFIEFLERLAPQLGREGRSGLLALLGQALAIGGTARRDSGPTGVSLDQKVLQMRAWHELAEHPLFGGLHLAMRAPARPNWSWPWLDTSTGTEHGEQQGAAEVGSVNQCDDLEHLVGALEIRLFPVYFRAIFQAQVDAARICLESTDVDAHTDHEAPTDHDHEGPAGSPSEAPTAGIEATVVRTYLRRFVLLLTPYVPLIDSKRLAKLHRQLSGLLSNDSQWPPVDRTSPDSASHSSNPPGAPLPRVHSNMGDGAAVAPEGRAIAVKTPVDAMRLADELIRELPARRADQPEPQTPSEEIACKSLIGICTGLRGLISVVRRSLSRGDQAAQPDDTVTQSATGPRSCSTATDPTPEQRAAALDQRAAELGHTLVEHFELALLFKRPDLSEAEAMAMGSRQIFSAVEAAQAGSVDLLRATSDARAAARKCVEKLALMTDEKLKTSSTEVFEDVASLGAELLQHVRAIGGGIRLLRTCIKGVDFYQDPKTLDKVLSGAGKFPKWLSDDVFKKRFAMAANACVIAAQAGLDQLVAQTGEATKESSTELASMFGASKFIAEVKAVFKAGRTERNSRTQMAPLRGVAALRAMHLVNKLVVVTKEMPSCGTRDELVHLKAAIERTIATRVIFETHPGVRNILRRLEEFSVVAHLEHGYQGAAAAIEKEVQDRMSGMFKCFDRAKAEPSDLKCHQLLLLASEEQAELKKIVANMSYAGKAASVLLDFQSKAQESLVQIHRGLDAMREEISNRLQGLDGKMDLLLGLDVLDHMKSHLEEFLRSFPRVPQEAYIESKLRALDELDGKSEPAIAKLKAMMTRHHGGDPAAAESVLVTGFAGAGKSTLVTHLRRELAQDFLANYNPSNGAGAPFVVVIYCNLPTLRNPLTKMVEEALSDEYGQNERQIRSLKHKAKVGVKSKLSFCATASTSCRQSSSRRPSTIPTTWNIGVTRSSSSSCAQKRRMAPPKTH
eukprot:TRINITY_DN6500_c0_g1_i3.p1 TRINITY_DN6500_c0_g1~~TRINITY_DN6500_c0_g1_i3.p1  ORF type:complete len:977 (-),score=184.78 TRINITY_DN6500_c0_g1_i3:166-3096(-)